MSGSVEASRRHGRFDLRWTTRTPRRGAERPALRTRVEDAPKGLDWEAVSKRYFPELRRHDPDAIGAYDAYSHETSEMPAHRLAPVSPPRGSAAMPAAPEKDAPGV